MARYIFYPSRKLRKHDEKPLWIDRLIRFLGRDYTGRWQTDVLTMANLDRVFSSDRQEIALPEGAAPYHNFSINPREGWHEHEILGRVFIPQSVSMNDGRIEIFVARIDNEFEIRSWPGFGGDPVERLKRRALPVLVKSMLLDAEQSFAALLSELGRFTAEDDKKWPVKTVGLEDLKGLVNMICPDFDEKRLQDIHAAADDPAGYYAHAGDIDKEEFDEPYPDMYIDMLLLALDEREALYRLDWKVEWTEVAHGLYVISGRKYKDLIAESDGEAAYDLMAVSEERMAEKGLALLNMDNRSDSYNLFVVLLDAAGEVMKLAEKCGIFVCPAREA